MKNVKIHITEDSPMMRVEFAKRKFGYILEITYLGIKERYVYATSITWTVGEKTTTFWIDPVDKKGHKLCHGMIELTGIALDDYFHFRSRSKNTERYIFIKSNDVYPCTNKKGFVGYDVETTHFPKKAHVYEDLYINGVFVKSTPTKKIIYTTADDKKYVKHGKRKRLLRDTDSLYPHYNNYCSDYTSGKLDKKFSFEGQEYIVPKDIYEKYVKSHWLEIFPDELT